MRPWQTERSRQELHERPGRFARSRYAIQKVSGTNLLIRERGDGDEVGALQIVRERMCGIKSKRHAFREGTRQFAHASESFAAEDFSPLTRILNNRFSNCIARFRIGMPQPAAQKRSIMVNVQIESR